MTPAPGAGGEAKRKKRRRRRPAGPHTPTTSSSAAKTETSPTPAKKAVAKKRSVYAKRVDEVSAGGLVIDGSGTKGLLIGRRDLKDATRERLLWSLPKGHIEAGETPEQAAIR